MDDQARKHWRAGQCDGTPFRVELWSDAQGAMVRAIQIGERPPTPYGDGELHAASADAAFAMAQEQVVAALAALPDEATGDAHEDSGGSDA